MAGNYDQLFWFKCRAGFHHVQKHWRPCQMMQYFWQIRLHSGAFTGGKDDDRI
jgi:hypothetical protein